MRLFRHKPPPEPTPPPAPEPTADVAEQLRLAIGLLLLRTTGRAELAAELFTDRLKDTDRDVDWWLVSYNLLALMDQSPRELEEAAVALAQR